ncbi:hypothetical protein [Vibrio jasicida]|uniref:PFGI-1 class ICE element type IV pilus protein PilL2 n=1 Tax=Vibrio jasicida TaxID=766224 RepID=UPI0005ED9328|nr:hypothetical protein [Vibrio jasicida]
MRMIALCTLGVLAGCASSEPPPTIPSPSPLNIRVAPPLSEATPIQTSRYVLERRAPADELTDMLNVPVDARMPALGNLTVKDGLDFLLRGSGMRVRAATSYGESQMFAQPLPLAHMNMGQIPLRQALQVLGGQAFELEEDVVKREVGFKLKPGFVWAPPKYDAVQPSAQLTSTLAANRNIAASSSASTDEWFDAPLERKKVAAAPRKMSRSQVMNKPGAVPVKSQAVSETLTMKQYNVMPGESYRKALLRWAHRSGFEQVALAQEPTFLTALDKQSVSGFSMQGSLRAAVAKLALDVPELSALTVYERPSQQLLALHPYRTQSVTAFVTEGATLEAVVEHAVKQYDWNWNPRTSWTVDNYAFGSAYPVVTRSEDISAALSILLKQYPLEARRLDATRTIYVREATPL